ncbi:MAG TPA: WYL domain-containing protein, partial [Candidatus Dormibacteraeota bacterium]|nr:WYL domain-containing protein [Candidatus Dormibacteraeota bacterium]
RLVTLLLLLQSRGGQTAAELARELEVSVRTVHRDVEALAASGVPIYADRGPHGGIRLVDGYRTRLTGMTAEEAEALFLSGMPGPAAELGLGTVVAAARLKVLAALPPELRTRATRLVERFHLDAAGWFQASEPVPHLATLSEAVWDARRVAVDYERGDERVRRVLEPLGLVIKAGVWYAVAATGGQIRTYRVSRVASAELLEQRFERPDRFDLAAYWAESSAAFERDVPRIAAILRVSEPGLPAVRRVAGATQLDEALASAMPDASGRRTLRLELDWPDEAAAILLGAGGAVQILQPAELREHLVSLATEALAVHAAVG